MTDPFDQLMTLAEVSATFAGFAALVTLFARRKLQGDAAHDLMRLRLVIGASVIVVMATLTPIAFAGLGWPDTANWQTSAALFLLLIYFLIGSFIASYRDVRGWFAPDRLAVAVVVLLEVLIQAALISVATGLAGEQAFGLYLASAILMVGQAAFVFLRLVESSFSNMVRRDG